MHLKPQSPWVKHSAHMANLYKNLAEWIEQHSIIPWHVHYDHNDNLLIVHIPEQMFFDVFTGDPIHSTNETLGHNYTVYKNGLLFTCFVPHIQQFSA